MKNTYIFIVLIIFIIAGMVYEKNSIQPESLKTEKAAVLSGKNPGKKDMPDITESPENVLIGYVQDFRDPGSVDYSKLTHVIFSFAHPGKDGKLSLTGETAMKNLRQMVDLAHRNNVKAILAVGGWFHMNGGESYDYFKAAVANPVSREKLVNELIRLVEGENLDGIDVDFEHPRSHDDAQNLASFTGELSRKLHAMGKELSVAVHAKIHSVSGTETRNIVCEPSMFRHADHVNIMAYDGQWDGGYDAANLSPYPFTEKIVNYWANLFEGLGISKEKLVLGVPSYAQPEDPAIKQVSYGAIIDNDPENARRDIISINGTTYHYNGETTIQKKTELAIGRGFGGMMLWELGLDAKGPYSITGAIDQVMGGPVNYYSARNSQ
ncbi:glycoside hydrolase family 18 protein [Bacillus marinisedimentorum]|uniref:glycoside hydrolase family 18 protein n=1 Tax=Bacillus marinisedimentorum TaxID=1821260 RepID=UPI0007DE8FBC|nr:glycoside hydrolase family 18 protein [Bacillus marinisedimentorum]